MKKVLVVISIIAVSAVALPAVARWVYPLKYKKIILRETRRYDLDPILLAAVIYEESKFSRRSRSTSGAVGLMQIMPATAGWVSREINRPELVADLNRPSVNLALGSWYFRYLLDRYHSDELALAAYNGGQKNLDKWLSRSAGRSADRVIGNIPFAETRTFIYRVRRTRRIYGWLYPELRRWGRR